MKINHFTDKNASKILATQSRRSDIEPLELCRIHSEMGKYLAYHMLDIFELEDIEIQHVQGLKHGVELLDKKNIIIIALMRAGLYAAEGVRSVFTESIFVLENGNIDEICSNYDFNGKVVIVVDAVINTGRSMAKIIETIQMLHCKKIFIATLIIQKESIDTFEKYQDIYCYALRISENKYFGKGGTDTGNRLFHTLGLE
jgi:uracil phosphoribosyltransferase